MKVVNRYKENYNVYIGRGSIFGNPFVIGKDGNREEVIKKYEIWVRKNPTQLQLIKDLPEKSILGCFCKPKACHGDIIVKIWKEFHKNE